MRSVLLWGLAAVIGISIAPRLTWTDTSVQMADAAGPLGALRLDGSTGFAGVAPVPALNLTGDWTVETWFKDDDPNGFNHDFRQILIKGDRNASPEAPYYMLVGRNSILAGVRTGGQDFPITANMAYLGLDPNAWHHAAATFRADLNVLNLWLDGRHIGYLQIPAHSAVGNTLPLGIGWGGANSGKFWLGKLHDLRLWNVARKGTDITASYQSEIAGAAPGLIANWRFDDSGAPLALDAVGGNSAALSPGARLVPLTPGCGLLDPPCADLIVKHSTPDSIVASPDATMSIATEVVNARGGAANVAAGARVLEETLPVVMSAGLSQAALDLWQHGSMFCGLSCTISPIQGDLINTVKYLGYTAPDGYQCTDPSTQPAVVSCWATRPDTITPGTARKFAFTVSLFDLGHPYVIVDSSVLFPVTPVTLPTTVRARGNPDGVIAELDADNDGAERSTTILAPFLEFRASLGSGCPVHGVGGTRSAPPQQPGLPIKTVNWTCQIAISGARSSAPAKLADGALQALVSTTAEFQVEPTPNLSVTLGCAVVSVPVVVGSGNFSCSARTQPTTPNGLWEASCTSGAGAIIPQGGEVDCQLKATLSAPDTHIQVGRDTAPLRAELKTEVIRFATLSTPVKQSFDLFGGSVDF